MFKSALAICYFSSSSVGIWIKFSCIGCHWYYFLIDYWSGLKLKIKSHRFNWCVFIWLISYCVKWVPSLNVRKESQFLNIYLFRSGRSCRSTGGACVWPTCLWTLDSCERVYERFLPADGAGGGHTMTSARKQANAGRPQHTTYNSSSHVLRVDSTAAIGHAAAREEVHVVVVSEPFLFFPGGGTMEGDEGRWRRREKELFLFILFKRCRKTRKTHQSKNSFSVGPLLWWKYCTQVQFWGTYTVHFYI